MAKKTTESPRGPTSFDEVIGLRIRTARNQVGMSQQSLGAALNISFQQVQKYELGRNRVTCSRLTVIAAKLGKPLSYFLDEVKYKPDSRAEQVAEFVGSHTGNAIAEATMILPHEQQLVVLQLARSLAKTAA